MRLDTNTITERLGSYLKKLNPGSKQGGSEDENELPIQLRPKADPLQSANSISKALAGAVGGVGEFYFPPEVIGGSCPRVVGEEEEIVWNAAAETCDTERVHVVWQSTEGKIWYLAVRSSELASHPFSWCPFAALLPGMKDAMPPPVCYAYYGDEMATMMTVTLDSLQVFRGTNLVVRAKAERVARELGNATIVELLPERIQTLTAIPWYSLSLFEDRARRILAAASVLIALGITALAFIVWLLSSMALIAARHDLSNAISRTEDKTAELMRTVTQLRASPLREQLANFADLNDGLLSLDGFLDVYEIKANKARWRAVVPSNVTADRILGLGGKTIESKDATSIIGNAAEVEYEASAEGKKR